MVVFDDVRVKNGLMEFQLRYVMETLSMALNDEYAGLTSAHS